MAEAHDENSINTDLTFDSGDENVCYSDLVLLLKCCEHCLDWSFACGHVFSYVHFYL